MGEEFGIVGDRLAVDNDDTALGSITIAVPTFRFSPARCGAIAASLRRERRLLAGALGRSQLEGAA